MADRIDEVFHKHFSSIGTQVRPVQRKIIQSVLNENNTLGLMQTGGGKSLCYWIAGKALGGITLVISPLTALMDEQSLKLIPHGCQAIAFHAGVDANQQYQKLIGMYNGRVKADFIFFSPERLATDGFVEFVLNHLKDQISLIVIDEAHCISQWGASFRPFYKEIPNSLDHIFGTKWPPVLCLTATLNPRDMAEICTEFSIEPKNVIKSDVLLRPEIQIRVVKVENEKAKDTQFWLLLEEHKEEKVLIFANRKYGRRGVEELCAEAQLRGFKAAFFHADLSSQIKADIIQRFRGGDLHTVFATSAFGMGIDISDIRGAIHYRAPESTEEFYQQVGRIGRDGEPSWAVIFHSDRHIRTIRDDFIPREFPSGEQIHQAYEDLFNARLGHQSVDYFEESDLRQRLFHIFLRSGAVETVCKGVKFLECFRPIKNVQLPEFQSYLDAAPLGMLVVGSKKVHKPEPDIMDEVYRWLADGKLSIVKSPAKCIVMDSRVVSLNDAQLATIQAELADKKAYRLKLLDEFVGLLESYQDSLDLHMRIGEYLEIDRFNRKRIHQTLAGTLVRSKSEVIVANILFQSNIPFEYEKPLFAPDHSWRLPDFTIHWQGSDYYWEHLGMLDNEEYAKSWYAKRAWYEKHFPGRLITTREATNLSKQVENLIQTHFTETHD